MKLNRILLLLILIVALNSFHFSLADEGEGENNSNLNAEIKNKEEELKEIESKIQTYENLVELKQKQQATLKNQLDIIEGEVQETSEKINKTEREMQLAELEIKALEISIKEKDIDINYNKKVLGELMRSIYHESQNSTIELLLKYEDIGDYFSEVERISLVNKKTKEILDEINKARFELQNKKEDRQNKYEKLDKLKGDNVRNKLYLEAEHATKEDILVVTEGEEEKYQEMLGRFQAQRDEILGDLETISSEKSGELNLVRSKQKKPKTGLASTGWFYSQRDSRWGNNNIGMSRTKMANYGCAVTCVAMVFKYHGIKIDPGVLAGQRIFYYDLIVWPANWQSIARSSSIGHGNIDWGVIDQEIENGNPVIIFIRANGKGAGHYVVIHHKDKNGEYVVHDPYWGPNIFLDSTRENISVLYGSGTSIDQMIIYHGKGGSFKELGEEETVPAEEGLKERCENSGGDWSRSKEKCSCPKKYELKEEECVKED